MSFAVPPPGAPTPRPDPQPLRGGPVAPSTPFSLPAAHATAPDQVPDVVRADVEAAGQRYQDLQRQGRELHFRVASDHRVVVDVCDLEGNVLRTVPPEHALDIVTGKESA